MNNQQSSALRRLETILDAAVEKKDKNQNAGSILLEVMGLGKEPGRLVDFYVLMNAALEEARQIKNKRKIERYLKTLEELHQIFIAGHIWGQQWKHFAAHIETKNVLIVLDSLADTFYEQNPSVFLEKKFLNKLNKELSSLRNEVSDSELSAGFRDI